MEIPKVSTDTVCPHIKSFTSGLTNEQWDLLEAGKPDNDTQLRLADMLVKVVCCIVDSLSNFLKQDALLAQVRASVEDSIACSFADALGVETVKGPSSEKLAELIATEVTSHKGSAQPKSTNAMVRYVCKMLKEFAHKIKSMCSTNKQSQHSAQTKECDPEDSLMDSSLTQSVQDIIGDEVNVIITPIVEEFTDIEYNQLQKEFAVDIQDAAEDIGQSVTDYISLKEVVSVQSSPESQRKTQKGLKSLKTKVSVFFAKMFAKASIMRVFSQIKAMFQPAANDAQSVKTLLVDAESVLQSSGKNQTGEDGLYMFHKLHLISPDDNVELTKKLSDLLYSHITGENVTEAVLAAASAPGVSEPQPYASMYAEIRHRVICFLSLMGWWLDNQIHGYSDKVVTAIMGSEAVSTTLMPMSTSVDAAPGEAGTSGEPEVDEIAEAEESKSCLRLALTSIIKRIWKAFKGDRTFFTDLESTIYCLVEETWSQLEGTNVVIKPGNVRNLSKVIHKQLLKRYGSVMRVLVCMERRDQDLPKYIATVCKSHLIRQRSAISRFFQQREKRSFGPPKRCKRSQPS